MFDDHWSCKHQAATLQMEKLFLNAIHLELPNLVLGPIGPRFGPCVTPRWAPFWAVCYAPLGPVLGRVLCSVGHCWAPFWAISTLGRSTAVNLCVSDSLAPLSSELDRADRRGERAGGGGRGGGEEGGGMTSFHHFLRLHSRFALSLRSSCISPTRSVEVWRNGSRRTGENLSTGWCTKHGNRLTHTHTHTPICISQSRGLTRKLPRSLGGLISHPW